MTVGVGLAVGAFDLVNNDHGGYKVETLAEGTEFGNAEPVLVEVTSLLQDGSLVVHERDGNAVIPLRVVITGSNAAALEDGAADLRAELYRRNTLTWTPPRDFGVVRVWDIITSSVARVHDDLAEVQRGERHYALTLTCEPFPRAESETVEAALAASGTTTTLVDDGSATTNWTGTTNGAAATVAVVSGAVGVTTAALSGAVTIALTRTASITTSATKYLVVDWKPGAGAGLATVAAFGDGVALPKMAQQASPTAGFTRAWFYVAAASVAVLRLESMTPGAGTPGSPNPLSSPVVRTFHVDNIDRTDIKPTLGTARQLLRSVPVMGSAPTQGSLTVEHTTSSLGDVMIYCWPDDGSGYSPPLRPYRVSGGTVTADAALVSGSFDVSLDTATVFDVPVSRLPVADGKGHTFLVMVRVTTTQVGAPSTFTVNWSAQTRINSTNVGTAQSGTWAFPAAPLGYELRTLGVLTLPVTDVGEATSAVVRLTMQDAAVDAFDISFDEGWLFDLTIGQLVQASCGTAAAASGGPSKRLFVRPATIDVPRPRVLRGHAADGSDAFYAFDPTAEDEAWMPPRFRPGPVNVLSVTSDALDAGVSLSYYERFGS